VVVVVGGGLVVVVVVGREVDGVVVGVAEGADVVVVATGWLPDSTWSRAVIVEAGGFGSVTLSGTKPTVIS
jgi:hypothetical protein